MGKKLKAKLDLLNDQVITIVEGAYTAGVSRGDALGLLCEITECGEWFCKDCPVSRESVKPENQNV